MPSIEQLPGDLADLAVQPGLGEVTVEKLVEHIWGRTAFRTHMLGEAVDRLSSEEPAEPRMGESIGQHSGQQ